MPILSDRIEPESIHPSPYRGCKWTTSTFGNTEVMLVHNAEGALVGKFEVPSRLATADFEQMMICWLETMADPLTSSERAQHLKLA